MPDARAGKGAGGSGGGSADGPDVFGVDGRGAESPPHGLVSMCRATILDRL